MMSLYFLDLSKFEGTAINGWIGPAFIILVAAIALVLAWKRKFRELIGFAIIAAICGVLVFGGKGLFGSKQNSNTGLSKTANSLASGVNTVMPSNNLTSTHNNLNFK